MGTVFRLSVRPQHFVSLISLNVINGIPSYLAYSFTSQVSYRFLALGCFPANLVSDVVCVLLVLMVGSLKGVSRPTGTDRNGPERTETDFLGTETDFSEYRNGPERTETDIVDTETDFLGTETDLSGYRN